MLKTHEKTFDIIIKISYLLYFLTFFGLYNKAPQYLKIINYIIHTYISIFLIVRFNPYTKIIKFTEFDRKIIFTAGIFLILSNTLINTIQNTIIK